MQKLFQEMKIQKPQQHLKESAALQDIYKIYLDKQPDAIKELIQKQMNRNDKRTHDELELKYIE